MPEAKPAAPFAAAPDVRSAPALPERDDVAALEAELRRTERALAEQEAWLRTIVELSADGIGMSDAGGRMRVLKRALTPPPPSVDVFPLAEVSAHYDLRRVDGETPLPHDEVPLVRAQAGEVVRHAEVVAVHGRDGSRRWLLCDAAPVHAADGTPLGAVFLTHDVTAARRADACMREQTAILEAIAEDAPLADVLDRIARHVEAELPGVRCVLRAAGVAADHLDEGARAGLRASAATSPDEGRSTAICGSDGELLGSCHLVHAESAAPDGAEQAVLESATRLARIALARAAGVERERRATRRFRALVEHTSDLITVVGRDGTITYVSPAAHALLGLPESDLVGRPATELVHPDDEAVVNARLGSLLRGEVLAMRAEYRVRRADGSWLQVATMAENLLDDPAVQGIVVNSRDVTERATLEAQLRQAQRMEALGHLAGGVAHDFNNLLLVIQASARFVADALAPGSVEAEDLAELRRAADRATDLTRQLLAFSRQQMLRPREVRLSEVTGGLRAMLRRLLDAGVALEVSHRPAADPTLGDVADVVHADPGQLEQVIVNLVVNARDAIGEHGTIRVRTSVERVDAPDPARPGLVPGRYATLAVVDDGHGMDAATLARVFEPFFTTRAQGKGTGLGLATVYGIVKQSGGYVYATSAPERGTTFTLLLPLVEGAAAWGAGDAGAAPAGVRERGETMLLLVEDEREVRRTVRKMLERGGYRVVEATDGRAALALLESPDGSQVAAVVSDVVMPEMSGRELVAALRTRAPGLPALLLSGYAAEVVTGHGVLVPGVEVLGKPFRAEELLAKVKALLERGGVARE